MKIRDYLNEQFQDIKGMYTFGGPETSIKGSWVKPPIPQMSKTGIKTLRVGMDAILSWRNPEAIRETINVMNYWGMPNVLTHNKAIWFKIGGFDRVMIKDESVAHNQPKFHLDFLYCTKVNPVPPEFQGQLAEFMPNLLFDGLKNEVTIRCNSMITNAVALGFVEDVVNGAVEPTVDELNSRQQNRNIPEWFRLPNVEWVRKEAMEKQYKDWKEKMDDSGGKYGRGYHKTLGFMPGDTELDLNIKEAIETKSEQPTIDWKKLENPEDQKYLDSVFKHALKSKNKKVLIRLKDLSKSGNVKIDFKSLEDPEERKYLDKILEETPFKDGDIEGATKFYTNMYPEYTSESIEKGLKRAWRKHKALDPVTVSYFLTGKQFGGLGFGREGE